ncbi:hypothetical protein D3C73_1196650 [compost metagenome]
MVSSSTTTPDRAGWVQKASVLLQPIAGRAAMAALAAFSPTTPRLIATSRTASCGSSVLGFNGDSRASGKAHRYGLRRR